MLRTLIAIVVALIGAAATTGALHAQGESTPGATPVVEPIDPEAAAAYCVEQGGEVRERVPVLNTNLPRESWVELGTPQRFCEFAQDEGDDPDSWISISLDTLYTQSPTLAALAYLTTPPMPEMTGGSNPSAAYCVHLGGAYDIGGGGGGWVTSDSDPVIEVQRYCVFADGSMIDAWGLTYHTGDVIRGADLTSILRYQPENPPQVFPGQ